jgi:predicted ATP-grasp superfamily ATP-dependent carboligase
VDALRSLGDRHRGGLLVPTSDEALTLVARHRDELSADFEVGCMDWQLTDSCLDKRKTHAVAEAHGIPVPRTFSPASADELRALGDELGYPCLVKPRLSHLYARAHGHKMEKVDTYDQLLRAWSRAREAGHEVLVQEFIPGPDHNGANYNLYRAGGEVWAECTAHKIRSREPEIASPRVVLSRHIPEVAELGRRVTDAVGVHGFVNVEFKRHARTGAFHLIEINARHNMSAALAVRCGLNFPLIEYRHRIHGERPAPVTAETGVYWISLEFEVRQARRLAARREIPRNYLRPYVRPHVYDVLDWSDPAPFAQWTRDVAGDRFKHRISGVKGDDGTG